jgi:hypothetical protein
MKALILVVGWWVLFVACWPVALIVLPFLLIGEAVVLLTQVVGLVIRGLLALLSLPARLLQRRHEHLALAK